MRPKAAHDPHIQFNLTAPLLPFAVFRKYFPLKMMASPAIEGFGAAYTKESYN